MKTRGLVASAPGDRLEMVETVEVVEEESLAAIASTALRIFFCDALSRSLNSTVCFPLPFSLSFALSPFFILALYSANLFSAACTTLGSFLRGHTMTPLSIHE